MDKRILIIAPHIDDEVLGCGGSIAKHKLQGNEVQVAYLTSGANDDETRTREAEAGAVCSFLDIGDYHFFRMPSRGIQKSEESIREMVRLFREFKPHVVYAPHKEEADLDHRAAHAIATEAVWSANGPYFPEVSGHCSITGVLLYEVHTPVQYVQYMEDITTVIEKKREAISHYRSQQGRTNYIDAILALNRYRALMKGVGEYAEAFQMTLFRNMFGG